MEARYIKDLVGTKACFRANVWFNRRFPDGVYLNKKSLEDFSNAIERNICENTYMDYDGDIYQKYAFVEFVLLLQDLLIYAFNQDKSFSKIVGLENSTNMPLAKENLRDWNYQTIIDRFLIHVYGEII